MTDMETRTRTTWLLLVASAILWVPVFVTLPMALYGRAKAQGTPYASHFRAIIRCSWIVLLLPFVLLALPSIAVSFVIGAVILLAFAHAALDGLRSATHGNHYEGLFA